MIHNFLRPAFRAPSPICLLLLLATSFIATGCTTPPATQKVVFSKTTGKLVHASYYGHELAGRRTASGEKFNPSGLTAAHKTLPLGTHVRVTNPSNGESVTVRINDRGPFVRGRELDVSFGAARALGFVSRGTANLLMEPL